MAERAGDGPSVLIDTDPQASLAAWWNGRVAQTPHYAPTTLKDLPSKLDALAQAHYAFAIIDTPPAITEAIRTVVALADLVLIPTRPSPHDLRAVGSTVELASASDRPFAFALTQAKANSRLTVQAMAALSEHEWWLLPSFMTGGFRLLMIDGRSGHGDRSTRSLGCGDRGLVNFVKSRINGNKKTR
jgi:chromosome partitioning protein